MKASEKFKVCNHCDGRVPVEVVICPYCATNLSNESPSSNKPFSAPKPASENLANLYAPPYASQRSMPTSGMEEKKSAAKIETKVMESTSLQTSDKSEILPISLLVIGSNLLTISVMQLLFSDSGLLRLEWNTSYWYLYSLVALPMLYFGIKALKKNS